MLVNWLGDYTKLVKDKNTRLTNTLQNIKQLTSQNKQINYEWTMSLQDKRQQEVETYRTLIKEITEKLKEMEKEIDNYSELIDDVSEEYK
jgi:uncharacterized protein YydD (DUF2326 family)